VEFAANGADMIALDIAGPVSSASNAEPATPEGIEKKPCGWLSNSVDEHRQCELIP
jgi:hypothetical protein